MKERIRISFSANRIDNYLKFWAFFKKGDAFGVYALH